MKNLNTIIFIDIDGTLLDNNLRANSGALPTLSKLLEQKGVLLGINSNRSLEDVLPVIKIFGITGPLILENGTYCIFNESEIFFVQRPKYNINKNILKIVRKFADENGVKLLFGDTVKLLKNINSNEKLILMNSFRKYSASVHIFSDGIRNRELAKKIFSLLKKQLNSKSLNVSLSNSSHSITCNIKKGSKTEAIKKIRSYFPDTKIYAIGNSVEDSLTMKYTDGFFAVANAEKEVQKKAIYVATKTYTQGVVEILRLIEKKK
jgi:HAD superfamily hydrolase (TIGR01484 family)